MEDYRINAIAGDKSPPWTAPDVRLSLDTVQEALLCYVTDINEITRTLENRADLLLGQTGMNASELRSSAQLDKPDIISLVNNVRQSINQLRDQANRF